VEELRIVAGDPALDLVNTVEPRIPGQPPERDHLHSPDALLSWAHRTGVIDAADHEQIAATWTRVPASAANALQDVLELRSLIGTLVDAARTDTHPNPAAAAALMRRAAIALERTTLVADPAGFHPARQLIGTQPSTRIPDRLAAAGLAMLQTTDLHRLKSCPPDQGGCGWVFIDNSKNTSRRWCSMEDCGTHAKTRRLTQRRRTRRAASDHEHDEPLP
jgi:predicted RNA-binding Zn ribbon-like protein